MMRWTLSLDECSRQDLSKIKSLLQGHAELRQGHSGPVQSVGLCIVVLDPSVGAFPDISVDLDFSLLVMYILGVFSWFFRWSLWWLCGGLCCRFYDSLCGYQGSSQLIFIANPTNTFTKATYNYPHTTISPYDQVSSPNSQAQNSHC